MEIFKDITGFEGLYQVSNYGNVRSLDRVDSRGYNLKGKAMKHRLNSTGYYMVNLKGKIKQKNCTVHQLVAIEFLNHKPNGNKGLVVDHVNNDKTINRLDNLQLISQRENLSKDRKGCSSKYAGVCWHKPSSKWIAKIHINGKQKYLGLFTDETEASTAYQNELKNITKPI
tara:strand:+ start:284 stop:796 length:513 start_codon:yes stop_codon:yes gene_type:complete